MQTSQNAKNLAQVNVYVRLASETIFSVMISIMHIIMYGEHLHVQQINGTPQTQ